jgi:hypothetical protein
VLGLGPGAWGLRAAGLVAGGWWLVAWRWRWRHSHSHSSHSHREERREKHWSESSEFLCLGAWWWLWPLVMAISEKDVLWHVGVYGLT